MNFDEFKRIVDETYREIGCFAPWTVDDYIRQSPSLVAATHGIWVQLDGPGTEFVCVSRTIEFSMLWVEHFTPEVAREAALHEAAHYMRPPIGKVDFEVTGGHDYIWEDNCKKFGIPANIKMPKGYLPSEPDWKSYVETT
jgi:hypothetical protein